MIINERMAFTKILFQLQEIFQKTTVCYLPALNDKVNKLVNTVQHLASQVRQIIYFFSVGGGNRKMDNDQLGRNMTPKDC